MGLAVLGDQMCVEVKIERIRKREESELVPTYLAWRTEEEEWC